MNVKPLDLEKLAKNANNGTNKIEGEKTNYFLKSNINVYHF